MPSDTSIFDTIIRARAAYIRSGAVAPTHLFLGQRELTNLHAAIEYYPSIPVDVSGHRLTHFMGMKIEEKVSPGVSLGFVIEAIPEPCQICGPTASGQ
jgi:hypothetical protein